MEEFDFLTTKRFEEKNSFQINTLSALAIRSMGRKRKAALKLLNFYIINIKFSFIINHLLYRLVFCFRHIHRNT